MRLTLKGTPITKKNHSQIVTIGGHPRIIQSKQYRQYEQDCLKQIPAEVRRKLDMPVCLKVVYYMPTRRKVDLTNLLAATCDILVKAQVILDDNYTVVDNHDGSRVRYDKENPRAEIEIIPVARMI